jgi:hypothetical protein
MIHAQGRSPQAFTQQSMPRSQPSGALITWVLLRWPLIGLLLYLFRQDGLAWIEQLIGVGSITERAIALISTFPERLLLAGLSAVVLASSGWAAQRLRSPALRYGVPLAIALPFFLLLFSHFSSRAPSLLALVLTSLLALNTLPADWLLQKIQTRPTQTWINLGIGLLPGVPEILLPRPFGLWLLGKWSTPLSRWLWLWPTVTLSLVAALMLNTQALVELGYRLHASAAVQIIDRGNINMLALSRDRHWLYATGHGLKHLLAYNLAAPAQPPRRSQTPSDYTQGFAYDPQGNRLYLYHKATQRLRVLDGTTLALLSSIPTPPIAPGDSWIIWDPLTQTVSIASEADHQIGVPFVVIDPKAAKVLHTSTLSPSYVFRSPDKPRLYMNFFRRATNLIAYDPQSNRVLKQVLTDQQVDRMALVAARNELLVTSPVNAQVLRYDADSLERRGTIATSFGVRSVAVDSQRHLLLTGSLATNMLEVIDLDTFKRRAVYRLGPWLREICLDTDAGIAYVSANGALYKVSYTAKL